MEPAHSVSQAIPAPRGIAVCTSGLEMHYRVGPELVRAVDGVSLVVPEGEFLLVRGRSGSGKTTLLHLLAGLQRPTEGTIRVGAHELHTLTPRAADLFRRRNVGLIFQFFNLIPSLTVEMNVALPLLLDGHRLSRLRGRIGELLDVLGMSHRRRHSPHQLSGGEMQRVAIARALVIGPKLILADEPTGNLDSKNAHDVFGILREQARARGVTAIVLTHDPDASGYADRVLEMQDGRVVKDTLTDGRKARAFHAS